MSREEPIRIVVVDDEDLGRLRIVNLLEGQQDVIVTGDADSVDTALPLIRASGPDIIFLDIQMPQRGGFELLDELGEHRPYVIFVTAHEEYALRGFDEHAVDFLLKPFDRERFRLALDRAVERVRSRRRDQLLEELRHLLGSSDTAEPTRPAVVQREGNRQDEPLRKLVVKSRAKKVLVDAGQIRWIEAANYYARLHTGDASHLIRRSLNWLEDHLDPQRFVRIHRSIIVNVEHVQEIVPWSAGSSDVRLDDGTKLRLSGSRKAELERLLGQTL